ncbi:MAG: class I SAM-dependent methyltransferase [Myxococcota bacterium]
MNPWMEQTVRWAYRGQQRSLMGAGTLAQRMARLLVRHVARRDPMIPSPRQQRALLTSFERLIERDYANAAAGIYPWSLLFQIPVGTYARALPRLVADLPTILARKSRDDWKDLPYGIDLRAYPPYYRRTFHWQSDGYLSRRSAELYDVGVELLFGGTADVMRRQTIPPVVAHARGRDRRLRVLEVACGTGRAGVQLLRALPDASYVGVDLSPYYLEVARERLAGDGRVRFVAANAESLPLPDASFDAVLCVFLFHELPRNARRRVFGEMRRVLRPGGCLVVEDSVQSSDDEQLGFFLERFPQDAHEPFYRDYLGDDLAEGLRGAGFIVHSTEQAFLSKVVSAQRPLSA